MDHILWLWNFFWWMVFIFLPAGIANGSASLSRKIPFPKLPINEKLFGSNKTWRGFIFGFIGSIACVELLWFLDVGGLIQYRAMSPLTLIRFSFLSSFGALGGDLLKSYFKRKKGIGPGVSWFPFDQIDWILGANVLLLLFCEEYRSSIVLFGSEHNRVIVWSWIVVFPMSTLAGIPIHMLFNLVSCHLKLQENKL